MPLKCSYCFEFFDNKKNFDEHLNSCHSTSKAICKSCKNVKLLVSKYNCQSCIALHPECKTCKRCIVQNGLQCNSCNKKKLKRKQIGGSQPTSAIFESKYFSNTDNILSLSQFLNFHNSNINNYIFNSANARGGIKFSSTISIEFSKIRDNEEVKTDGHFTTSQKIILPNTNFNFFEFANNDFENKMERFTSNGSNWILNKPLVLSIDLVNYNPFT